MSDPINISYEYYQKVLSGKPSDPKIEIIKEIRKGKIYTVNKDNITYRVVADKDDNLLLKDE
jgi:hypothetical protein